MRFLNVLLVVQTHFSGDAYASVRIHDGQRVVAALVVDVRDTRAGRAAARPELSSVLAKARRPARLRERSGRRGVERHVAFDLLHDLVDVSVQHRHRSERFR